MDEVKDTMLFTDKKVFGDNNEHEYDVVCRNGIAHGAPTQNELENFPNSPKDIVLYYGKLEDLTDKQKRKCLDYRGLYDAHI